MSIVAHEQTPQALVKITQRVRGGMLLTDTYVVSHPVLFNVDAGNLSKTGEAGRSEISRNENFDTPIHLRKETATISTE